MSTADHKNILVTTLYDQDGDCNRPVLRDWDTVILPAGRYPLAQVRKLRLALAAADPDMIAAEQEIAERQAEDDAERAEGRQM